jgi:hypothetical protein
MRVEVDFDLRERNGVRIGIVPEAFHLGDDESWVDSTVL